MYFAAVAPPKPPPTTTTRAFEGAAVAQPVSDNAPASLRKSRLFMASPLLRGEPGRKRVDLGVAVTLRDLVHHRRWPLAVAERAHLRRDVVLRQAGERNHRRARRRLALRAVADRAGGRKVAAVFLGLHGKRDREHCGKSDGSAHELLPMPLRK